MPIVRNSDQKSNTLIGFYKEIQEDKTNILNEKIGETMVRFLQMVNETFSSTTLFGLTSHYSLVIQPNDKWDDDTFVTVYTIGDGQYQFEYKVPEDQQPWKHAIIKGQANTIHEAKDYLIIAMFETEGWIQNKELRKLYYKLKKYDSNSPKFKLWLEFEEVDPGNWDIENEFCNIHVDLEDGRHYGINVWTYNYFQTSIEEDQSNGENVNGIYQIPPDLFVKELTRDCIKKTIQDLLKNGDLDKVLNPSIFSKNYKHE